jgi:hypothetical protein
MSQDQNPDTAWQPGGERRGFGGITFDGSVHCGAGHSFEQVGVDHFRCRSRSGDAPYSWRLHLCIESPGDGREITLEVADFNHCGQELWQESAAVVSRDGQRWADLGAASVRIVPWTPTGDQAHDESFDDGWHPPYGVQFRLRLDSPKLWLATPAPYPLRRCREHLRALAERCADFEVRELGPSNYSALHGFPPPLVKVAKPGKDGDRIRVVVIAGEHPAESAGMFACEGLLDELLRARDLLADFSFWVIPVANVDGVAFGRTYHNMDPDDPAKSGVNLNRDWKNRSQLETQASWRLLQEVRPHCFLNLHNGRHRREAEVYSLPDGDLGTFMRHLRAHLPLPLERWRPATQEGMGCREVRQAGLAEHAFCIETLLLRKAPGCPTFPESYRRVGMGLLRGIVAALREVYGRPNLKLAVPDPTSRPVRCHVPDFVAQLPSFYYSDDFAALAAHNRLNVEVNGLPLTPGHYDVWLAAKNGIEKLNISQGGRSAEPLPVLDGWLALRSVPVPGHKVMFGYECESSETPLGEMVVCPEGMPKAEALRDARELRSPGRDTGVSERPHLREWGPFYQKLTAPRLGSPDLEDMLADLVRWSASRQVLESGHPYRGAVYSEEDKYDARDAAAAAAVFARQASLAGDAEWHERALLARQYVYRSQVHEPGNLPRHGGFVHMVHGIWGVNFSRLDPPYPGIDGVDTCAIIHLLCRTVDLGLPFGDVDRQAIREAAQWVANSEVLPGMFLHHEGARHDCQNMNALALSALARAHATLTAAGESAPDAWLEAAVRGLGHYLDGQEAIGVWPYIFAQAGVRGGAYSQANIPDHGIGMYHLTRALERAPIAAFPGLREALGRAARWYLCLAWTDGDTIDLEYGKQPELGGDICFSGFTWCRFTAAATLIRLARFLDDPGPWRQLGLSLMEHVRRKRWQTSDPEHAPVVAHARPEAPLATWCQTAEWDAVMLGEMIEDLA